MREGTLGVQRSGRCNWGKCYGLVTVCWNSPGGLESTGGDETGGGVWRDECLGKVQIYPGHNHRLSDRHYRHAGSEKLWIGGQMQWLW